MSDGKATFAPPLAPVAAREAKAPPHPLDASWHIHLDDQVYGPYTGHELKDFAAEGRMDGLTNVVRVGREDWKKAAEDPSLAKIFKTSAPPPPGVNAAKGATVVQVNNNPMPGLAAAMLEDGEFGPKSAGLAFLFSFLICGGGQLYNGQIAKGILMFFGCIVLWFVLLGWVINIWSWVDAYQTAKKMNARYHRRLLAGMPI